MRRSESIHAGGGERRGRVGGSVDAVSPANVFGYAHVPGVDADGDGDGDWDGDGGEGNVGGDGGDEGVRAVPGWTERRDAGGYEDVDTGLTGDAGEGTGIHDAALAFGGTSQVSLIVLLLTTCSRSSYSSMQDVLVLCECLYVYVYCSSIIYSNANLFYVCSNCQSIPSGER